MKKKTLTEGILQFYYSSVLLVALLFSLQWWQYAGSTALTVFIGQCSHTFPSKALQISRVLLSAKLNMLVFNPFMCNTFTGDSAHYYFVTNIHSHSSLACTTQNSNQIQMMLI